ncbi:amyloid-beta precursor protein-like [Amphiura filiformis]|uniref:amyloid-beta precursor protein-like n=1 Tax=Amphiura filiformis TaxID=82378 RepID=UPI003B2132BA
MMHNFFWRLPFDMKRIHFVYIIAVFLLMTPRIVTGMCFQSAESGPCRAGIRRWAYDATANRCYEFFYGGCQGNRNNFHNQEECMSKCGGTHRFRSKTKKIPPWIFDMMPKIPIQSDDSPTRSETLMTSSKRYTSRYSSDN